MSLERAPVVTPQVAALLAFAMYPDPERAQATLERYAHDPARQVWVWTQDARPVCAAGLSVTDRRAELLHLGTLPEARGQGAGRSLLHALMKRLDLARLEAETDDAAAGFYRRCGFEVSETGSRAGSARFLCVLTAARLPP